MGDFSVRHVSCAIITRHRSKVIMERCMLPSNLAKQSWYRICDRLLEDFRMGQRFVRRLVRNPHRLLLSTCFVATSKFYDYHIISSVKEKREGQKKERTVVSLAASPPSFTAIVRSGSRDSRLQSASIHCQALSKLSKLSRRPSVIMAQASASIQEN